MSIRQRPARFVVIALVATSALLISGSAIAAPVAAAESDLRYGITDDYSVSVDPGAIAIDESTNTVYVADGGSRAISVVSGSSGKELKTLHPLVYLTALAISSSTGRLYIASDLTDTVTSLDPATGQTLFTAPAGDSPRALTIDEDRGIVWVVNRDSGSVSPIDSETGAAIAPPISVGTQPTSLAVDSVANMVYVTNFESGTVSVIDGSELKLVRTVPVESSPASIVVDDATHTAYVAYDRVGVVSVIKPNQITRAPYFDAGSDGGRIALDPLSNDLVLLGKSWGSITAVDRSTGVVRYLNQGHEARTIAMNSVTGVLYVADGHEQSLFVGTKGAPPIITSTKLSPSATATIPYRSTPLQVSVSGAVKWSIVAITNLELSIVEGTGVVSGTPSTRGTFPLTVRAQNAFGYDDAELTLWIAEQPRVAPTIQRPVSDARVILNAPYSAWISFAGYPAPSISVSGLPKGLSFKQGYITGTPRKLGTFPVTIAAKNSSGSASLTYPLTITGQGSVWAHQLYERKETKVDGLDRKHLRKLVHSIRKGATIESYEIYSEMYNSGSPKKDLSRAKKKAFAVSAYLRHLGFKAKPTYTFFVEKHSENKVTSGHAHVVFSYKK